MPVPRDAARAGVAWAVTLCLILVVVRLSYWWIGGDDGHYHIRVAAELRERVALYMQGLPWTRMSVFTDRWGDKELLFHWFLIPFAWGNLFAGAKVALSVLNGVAAGVMAFLAVRLAGRSGWAAPAVAMGITTFFTVRMDQLRPHNLSLILLMLLAHEAAARRRWTLVLLGFLYALSYTAWQTPAILCAGVFAAFALLRREWRWELLWAPVLGLAAGILAHPGFPDNVHIWTLQNLAFFQQKDALPVGTEINPESLAGLARSAWTGLVLLALAAALRWPWGTVSRASDLEMVLGVFAAATLILFFRAIRFAEYAIPFATLYAFALWGRLQAGRVARRLGSPRAALVMTLAIAIGAAVRLAETTRVMRANHALGFASLDDARRFRQALPAGAKVAATWDFTPYYLLAAPQGRYLNVLDPIFMSTPYPEAYALLERLYAGSVPDVPGALTEPLDSDYLAYNSILFQDLDIRVGRDPRLIPVFQSVNHQVVAVDRERGHGFVTDWRLDTAATASYAEFVARRARVAPAAVSAPYDPRTARALVSAPGAAAGGCWWASRRYVPAAPRHGMLIIRFGSAGPAEVYADGRRILSSAEGHGGLPDADRVEVRVSGRVPVDLAVRACPSAEFGSGFFWREEWGSRPG
ncbi:MAG TPA: hypothetical protein VLE53_13570 [Gemmatimonadaceae bacterium]|nr:hypothetical protein [Gemmatimonadaceae bacterium]